MENLKYPNMHYIITALTVKDFAIFTKTDPETGVAERQLLIKKGSQVLPWISTTANSIVVEQTKLGAYKSILLKVNAPAPCDLCHYEYGVNVHVKYQQPGNQNDQYYPVAKHYGGVLEAIQTPSGGYMADSDILLMEDTILTGICNDQATINVREPAIVTARRLYILTTAAANSAIYNITVGATTTVVTANTGSTVLTQANDINATAAITASIVAFAIDATHIAITSVNCGLLFTVADGGGATTLSGITRYMWIYALNADPKFYIDWDSSAWNWATVTPFNLLVLDNTSAAAGNSVMYVGGTASGNIANNATSTTYAASITGSSIGSGGGAPAYVYASAYATAGSVYVYVYSGANEVRIKSLGTAGVTVNKQFSGKGVWPSLTWQQVFNVFMNANGMEPLSNYVYNSQPAPDSLWNKIVLTIDTNTAAIHGASHRDTYRQVVEIYIQQGYGGTNLWDASGYRWENNADAVAGLGGDTAGTFTADKTINDILDTWTGLTHGSDFKTII
jgi:hypothetical protein